MRESQLVALLQRALNVLMDKELTVDGIPGEKTDAVIEEFNTQYPEASDNVVEGIRQEIVPTPPVDDKFIFTGLVGTKNFAIDEIKSGKSSFFYDSKYDINAQYTAWRMQGFRDWLNQFGERYSIVSSRWWEGGGAPSSRHHNGTAIDIKIRDTESKKYLFADNVVILALMYFEPRVLDMLKVAQDVSRHDFREIGLGFGDEGFGIVHIDFGLWGERQGQPYGTVTRPNLWGYDYYENSDDLNDWFGCRGSAFLENSCMYNLGK